MIEVSHLSKSYGSRPAVQDLSFTVPDGQIYGLLGPNGAGKSTIMNILTGYLAPTEGEVKVAGFRLPEQAQQAKACVGYLPEQPPLYPEMTVQEYLDFVAELKGVKRAQRKQQVLAVAHRTGLEEVLPRVIRSLSKGYRQRVGIAQALLGEPPFLIFDEPTVGLDPEERIRFRNLFSRTAQDRLVLLSTHIIEDVQSVCDQIVVIDHGRILFAGTPEGLIRAAEGHVGVFWERDARRETGLQITARVNTGSGIRCRAVADTLPAYAEPEEPSLEDAYLYLIHQNAGEAAR